MVSAESTNKNKIIFDGILLDSKYQPLIDDLRRKGISTLDQIRNTALSEYAKNKYQSQPDYLHDLRVCIAKTSDSFSYTKRWDDAIGNRVLIQLFTTEGFILSKCNSLRIRNLFDLFSLSENELNTQFTNSKDFREDVADAICMPVAALYIPEKVVNILIRNGIMTVGKLTMTGAEYLSQLPGMNSELISSIEASLTKLPEELANFRKITYKTIKVKTPNTAPISVNTTSTAKDISAISTSQVSTTDSKIRPIATVDGFRKYLVSQGKELYIENYVRDILELESPLANLEAGIQKLFNVDAKTSMNSLISIRNTLPGTKLNTEKYKSTLSIFESFLQSISNPEKQLGIPTQTDSNNVTPEPEDIVNKTSDSDNKYQEQGKITLELIEEIRSALELLSQRNPQGVFANKVFYQINRQGTMTQVKEILEKQAWAHQNQDGSFSYLSVKDNSTTDTEITSAPTVWVDYEAAILLNACLEMKRTGKNRNSVISEVSKKLRQIAKYKGYTIDASFRNENGITNQLKRMESAIAGKTIEQPSTRQFRNIVEMYKTDRGKFDSLLSEADKLIHSGKNPTGTEIDTGRDSQPRWNEMEAAILLDAYLKVREHPEQRKEYVQKVSEQLRQIAVNQGQDISDVYRNYAGIDRQMYSMETAWTGGEPNGHAIASKLFTQIVWLYRSNRTEFDVVLRRAQDILNLPDEKKQVLISMIEQDFRKYLGNHSYDEEKTDEIVNVLKNIEKLGIEEKWGVTELFGDDPQKSLESMKIIQANLSFPELNTKENRNVLRIFAKYLEDSFDFVLLGLNNEPSISAEPQSEILITRDGFKAYLIDQGIVEKKVALLFAYLGIIANKSGIEKTYNISQSEAKKVVAIIEKKFHFYELRSEEKEALRSYEKYICGLDKNGTSIEKPPLEIQFREFLRIRHYSEKEITDIVSRLYRIETFAQNKLWIAYNLFEVSPRLSSTHLETIQKKIEKTEIDTFQNRKALNAYGVFLKQEIDTPVINVSPTELPIPVPTSPNPPVTVQTPPAPTQLKSLEKKIEEILTKKDTTGMTIFELKNSLSAKQYEIQDAIQKSTDIIEIRSKYYHKDAFIDLDEAADQLESILNKLMAQNDNVTTAGMLFKFAHSEMNMFLNDNDLDDQKSVYDIAKHFFMKCHYHGKSYNFADYTYITNTDVKIEKFLDLVIHFGKSLNRPFTQEELIKYLEKLELPTSNIHGKMQVGIKPVIFFYDAKEYLIAESMNIDNAFINRARDALARLLQDSGEYVIHRNITDIWYYQMPPLPYNLNWTPLLLQQVLNFYGGKIGFRTIPAMDTQYLDTLHAVLVPNDSWIKDFRDAAAIFLHENYPNQEMFEAEELRQVFVKSGMIKGNELIWNMHKALGNDERFMWDSDGSHVRIQLS